MKNIKIYRKVDNPKTLANGNRLPYLTSRDSNGSMSRNSTLILKDKKNNDEL